MMDRQRQSESLGRTRESIVALGQSKLEDPVVRRAVVQWKPERTAKGGELQHGHKTSPVARRSGLLGLGGLGSNVLLVAMARGG